LDIEEEIDNILKAQRAKSTQGDESAVDEATLNVAAHRLESLITIDELCLRRDRQLPPRPKRRSAKSPNDAESRLTE